MWFLAGALTHRLLSFLLARRLEQEIMIQSLLIVGKLFKALEKDVEFAINQKQESLKFSNISDNLLNSTLETDNKFIAMWQTLFFKTVILSIPPRYVKKVPQYVWSNRINLDNIIRELEEERNEH